MVAGTVTVEVPTSVTPLRGGLLAHVSPVDVPGSRLLAGVQYDPPYACWQPESIPDWCADPRGTKNFASVAWQDSTQFTGYIGVQCGPFGGDDLAGVAQRTLGRNIGFAAEQAFVSRVAGSASVKNTTAVGALEALGMAEAAAALLPGGHIYVSRSSVPFLRGQVHDDDTDGVLYTKQATPLVNMVFEDSSTAISGTTPGANEFWILVTGQPRVWLGSVVASDAEELQRNDWYSLAEQVGAVSFDCGAVAILASHA